MKKAIVLILTVTMIFSLFLSCESGDKPKESNALPLDVITSLMNDLKWESTITYTKADIDALDADEKEARISVLYGDIEGNNPDLSVFEDYAIVVPGGEMSAREIGIFKLSADKKTDEAIEKAKAFMTLRVNNRKEVFAGYAPEAVAMAEDAVISVWGRYVFYCIADDSADVSGDIVAALEAEAL